MYRIFKGCNFLGQVVIHINSFLKKFIGKHWLASVGEQHTHERLCLTLARDDCKV